MTTTDPMANPCPTCGALAGEPCQTKKAGRWIEGRHTERRPVPPTTVDETHVMAEAISEELTYDRFEAMSDDELAETLVMAIHRRGWKLVEVTP